MNLIQCKQCELLKSLKDVLQLIEDDILVRDTSMDSDYRHFLKTGTRVVNVLGQAIRAIDKNQEDRRVEWNANNGSLKGEKELEDLTRP